VTTHPVLHKLARFGVRLGLDRMRSFLGRLGDPHRAVPVIHVAGTNGKGSVAHTTAALLTAAGLRVGTYTSPHLQRINERIRVDGEEISTPALDELLRTLDGLREEFSRTDPDAPGEPLTYFEMMTAVAFTHFARVGVDVAVVEVGLGGRLDATNVVSPVVTAITSVGLDHTAQLGDDLASIAAEKGGIVKAGVPVIVGPLAPPALQVIRGLAADVGAPLQIAGEHHRITLDHDGCLTFQAGEVVWRGMGLGLLGDHQADNAGVAIDLARTFLARRFPDAELRPNLSEQVVRGALQGLHVPGRLEWLGPDLLVDCAHNPDGAAGLATFLAGLPRDRPRTLLLGVSEDKDARNMVIPLAPQVDRILTTHCGHPRAAQAGDLAAQLVGVAVPVLPAGPIEEALPLSRGGGELIVAAGSVFLVGAVRELVGRA
jgi:dihydrofolate synthase/folylpolyglutamate synthase